jgi:hypothetical protein
VLLCRASRIHGRLDQPIDGRAGCACHRGSRLAGQQRKRDSQIEVHVRPDLGRRCGAGRQGSPHLLQQTLQIRDQHGLLELLQHAVVGAMNRVQDRIGRNKERQIVGVDLGVPIGEAGELFAARDNEALLAQHRQFFRGGVERRRRDAIKVGRLAGIVAERAVRDRMPGRQIACRQPGQPSQLALLPAQLGLVGCGKRKRHFGGRLRDLVARVARRGHRVFTLAPAPAAAPGKASQQETRDSKSSHGQTSCGKNRGDIRRWQKIAYAIFRRRGAWTAAIRVSV